MTRNQSAHRPRPLLLVIGLVVIAAVVATVLGLRSPRSSSASPPTKAWVTPSSTSAPSPMESRERGGQNAVGEADGVVPDGVTVFDDTTPAVGRLDPDLLKALRQAATDASGDGVTFSVNSGWRSPEYQNRLLREAVDKYGSEAEAAQWVATADTSPHVSGDAVDLGRSGATAWLSEHGAAYGLCQIYGNEPWHYELRTEAVDHGCPAQYADPTEDPRMQQ
ncbi:M15 family metallopeptidase [Streptomyces sp. NBC_00006]|uniref:M15 family metallopeptidase n=1 Tax=Streptomyces sp. NBC_00006 TaxID=2975619 RepID=UPI002258E436|nr:M15 family metallopeptidase [Streptomyces sp. NBC_00006]MCX5536959.1 M15 family metallopeptidase [Streptomyces sp. NBC_00006]